MSTSQRHLIGRIVLELETTETADTWTLQSALSELLQHSGSVEIEQLLSQRVSTREVIRLDQLVVELPPFSSQEITERFIPQLLIALSRALDEHLGNAAAERDVSSIDVDADEFGRALRRRENDSDNGDPSLTVIAETSSRPLRVPPSASNSPDEDDSNRYSSDNIRLNEDESNEANLEVLGVDTARADRTGLNERNRVSRHVQYSEWESFLYFLTYGRAPWWQEALPFAMWVERWEAILQADAIAWQHPLKQCLASSTQARARLINQLPISFCHQLVINLQPAWVTWPRLLDNATSVVESVNAQSTSILFSTSTLQYLEQQAWLAMLAEVRPSNAANAPFPTSTWLETWLTVLIDVLQTNNQLFDGFVVDSANSGSSDAVSSSRVDEKRLSVADAFADVLREAIASGIQSEVSVWLTAVDLVCARTGAAGGSEAEHGPSSPALLPSGEGDQSQSFSSEGERVGDDRRDIDRSSEGFLGGDRDRSQVQQSDSTVDAHAISDTETQSSSNLQSQHLGPENTVSNVLPNAFVSDEVTSETPLDVANLDSSSNTSTSDEVISETPSNVSDLEITNLHTDSLNQLHLLANNPPKRSSLPALSLDEQENGIYLNQAGLVILHPFLTIYFEEVGLLTDGTFSNEHAQQQAIALLHYLSTGQTNPPEYELVLPKLLCNWPLNEPIATNIALSPNALAEADNLLNAVINYWDALKNTTIDGLREGFLQRPGKLAYRDGWKLQVEQQAIDILLSRLPWGLGMVKLPWMTDVLVVEWA